MKLSRRSVLRATAVDIALRRHWAHLASYCRNGRHRRRTASLAARRCRCSATSKYPEGFKHFDYVNPNAPKGGTVRQIAFGTFDNFNLVVAGVKGSIAAGTELLTETLMTPALDEVSTEYGLLAEAVSYPDDLSLVTYRLRANARWHDGKPVTPEDVIFSFDAFKKQQPAARRLLPPCRESRRRPASAKSPLLSTGRAIANCRRSSASLPVLPKHWWEGTDKSGRKRDITQTTLEPPLGCGALSPQGFRARPHIGLRSASTTIGARISMSIVGTRQLRRDSATNISATPPSRSKPSRAIRSTGAPRTAPRTGRPPTISRPCGTSASCCEEFPIRNFGVMQAFAFNIRRDKFKDARVRRAFNFAFDFEEMNKQIFFGQYKRIAQLFRRHRACRDAACRKARSWKSSKPCATRCRPSCSPSPTPIRSAAIRRRCATICARRCGCCSEAGYEVRNTKLVNAKTGEPFTVEFLVDDPASERFVLFYKPSLERLGINVTVRTVDAAQYENRLRQWDFDIIVASWGQSLSPGNEQRGFWGSQAADQPGSRNLVGIKNPAIDALIDRVIFTKDRDDLVAATKALDRVLLWNYYVVPQWTYGKVRTARWDRFGRPDNDAEIRRFGFPDRLVVGRGQGGEDGSRR